jgi:hypothetical protein
MSESTMVAEHMLDLHRGEVPSGGCWVLFDGTPCRYYLPPPYAQYVAQMLQPPSRSRPRCPTPDVLPAHVVAAMDLFVANEDMKAEMRAYLVRKGYTATVNESTLRTAYVIRRFFEDATVDGIGTKALIRLLKRSYGTLGRSQFFELKRVLLAGA